jgi:CDC-like kinase
MHEHRLTHTDLKPENILFVNSDFSVEMDPKKKKMHRVVKECDVRMMQGCQS